MATPGVWLHRDELGPAATVELGMSRALSGDWQSGAMPERIRAFRGWLLEHAMAQARLTGTVSEQKGEDGATALAIDPGINDGAPEERARATQILTRSLNVLATAAGAELAVETVQPKGSDTGAWPIIAAAVVVSIGQVVAIGYLAHQTAQVIDRKLERDHDFRMLVQRDAQVVKLVRAHTDREDKAKKQLPLDEATKLALNGLLQQQEHLVKKKLPKLSSGIPDSIDIPSGAAGFGLGLLLAIGAGVYLLATS